MEEEDYEETLMYATGINLSFSQGWYDSFTDPSHMSDFTFTALVLSSDDEIRMSNQDDTAYGFDGDDAIYGYAGDDKIYGGAGKDYLNGGVGADILRGEGAMIVCWVAVALTHCWVVLAATGLSFKARMIVELAMQILTLSKTSRVVVTKLILG